MAGAITAHGRQQDTKAIHRMANGLRHQKKTWKTEIELDWHHNARFEVNWHDLGRGRTSSSRRRRLAWTCGPMCLRHGLNSGLRLRLYVTLLSAPGQQIYIVIVSDDDDTWLTMTRQTGCVLTREKLRHSWHRGQRVGRTTTVQRVLTCTNQTAVFSDVISTDERRLVTAPTTTATTSDTIALWVTAATCTASWYINTQQH